MNSSTSRKAGPGWGKQSEIQQTPKICMSNFPVSVVCQSPMFPPIAPGMGVVGHYIDKYIMISGEIVIATW